MEVASPVLDEFELFPFGSAEPCSPTSTMSAPGVAARIGECVEHTI